MEMEGDFSSGLTIRGGDHDHCIRHGPFLLHLKALFCWGFIGHLERLVTLSTPARSTVIGNRNGR